MTTELRVVDFVREATLADVDPDALVVVRRVLAGALATAVAGAGEEGIAPLRRLLVERAGTPQATTIVFGDRLPGASAALLNATMGRALDFCDAMAPGVHVGSSVVPAALAAAEMAGGCTGPDFLRAVVVGCEIGARFNLTEEMYDGMDPTGVASVFAATAAAGAILGLSGEQMRNALGLALNRCSGSFQSNVDGSLAVRLQQGLVAQAAIDSVQYAAAGITGPVNFLEGVYSYTHLYARDRCAPEDFAEGLGDVWRVRGFMFKKFPSCGATQGVTQLTLDARRELTLTAGDVERIVVTMPPYCQRLVGNPFVAGPNPRVSAQFSVQYCVANAIVRGAATLREFRPEAVLDESLAPLMAKVDVIGDATMDRRGHSSVDIELTLRDGRVDRRGYDTSPGYPGNDLDADDHRRRFDDCMAYAELPLAPGAAEQLLAIVAGIEAEPDITAHLGLLRSPA